MALLKESHKATVSNDLNQMTIRKPMTLQQLRFFTVYQSRIYYKDINTRIVKFTLDDYAKIIGCEMNPQSIKDSILDLLEHTVLVPSPAHKNGKRACHLFSYCDMYNDDHGNKMIEFNAHDDVLPYLFDLKNNFTSYEIWNILRLKSVNQARLYQLLKQYQKAGTVVYTIEELKEKLGIDKKKYADAKIFVRDVIKVCQEALEEITDIRFEYRTLRKTKYLPSRVEFKIFQNKNYKKDEILEDSILATGKEQNQLPGPADDNGVQMGFLDPPGMDAYVKEYQAESKMEIKLPPEKQRKLDAYSSRAEILVDLFEGYDFSTKKLEVLYDAAIPHIPDYLCLDEYMKPVAVYDYIQPKWQHILSTMEETKATPYSRLKNAVKNNWYV